VARKIRSPCGARWWVKRGGRGQIASKIGGFGGRKKWENNRKLSHGEGVLWTWEGVRGKARQKKSMIKRKKRLQTEIVKETNCRKGAARRRMR